MSNNITLTPGKHYRTREGKRVRIYATDGGGEFTIHAARQNGEGWYVASWRPDGKFTSPEDHPFDIIAEWIDRPEGGWEHLPTWIKWRAMDENGVWWCYSEKPEKKQLNWASPGVWNSHLIIPPAYCPTFSGPWTDSLDERPEGGK